MKNEIIQILKVEPGKAPVFTEIENTLEAMQEVVGGYIEMVDPWGGDVALICNEEGLLNGLTPNRLILDGTGRVFDVICGTFFLCLAPRNSKHFTSLPKMFGDMFGKYMIDYVDVK